MTKSAVGRASTGDPHDYAAIATPVTSAQVVNAWLRPEWNFAAVSWSGRREKTLASC
jgi:hypothetical protein